jgi:hypothetical protein
MPKTIFKDNKNKHCEHKTNIESCKFVLGVGHMDFGKEKLTLRRLRVKR